MGQRPCLGGPLQEPPRTSPASVEEAVREAVAGFRRIGRRSRPRDACCVSGAVAQRPRLPGATCGSEPFVASEAAAAKKAAAEHARLPKKFTVIVSQKTSAGKREARAASPGRDSMHAWPLSQSLCMCAAWTREDGLD